jgi:hypothetical protein
VQKARLEADIEGVNQSTLKVIKPKKVCLASDPFVYSFH